MKPPPPIYRVRVDEAAGLYSWPDVTSALAQFGALGRGETAYASKHKILRRPAKIAGGRRGQSFGIDRTDLQMIADRHGLTFVVVLSLDALPLYQITNNRAATQNP